MNPSQLAVSTQDARARDSRRQAEVAQLAAIARERRRREARRPVPAEPYREHVVIRSAARWDEPALESIAQLDGRPLPRGEMLVAEVGGEVVAAIGLADGREIADPFRPTADLLTLLRLRRDQLRGQAAGRPPRGGVTRRAHDALRAFVIVRRQRRRTAVLAGGGR